jgi:hypothetical protein
MWGHSLGSLSSYIHEQSEEQFFFFLGGGGAAAMHAEPNTSQQRTVMKVPLVVLWLQFTDMLNKYNLIII